MADYTLEADRTIDSTDNNEFATGLRDETMLAEEMVGGEIPLDDEIPESVDEAREGDRPLYNEMGMDPDQVG